MARSQTPEAQSFIQRVLGLPKGPGVSLDLVLQPSLEDEAELRCLFATDKAHARLSNPYVGLVDVFAAPADMRITRARVVKDETDLSAQYVMPLSEANRRKEGAPCMVSDIDEFKKNWGVFSEGSLSQLLDWNNVVAAGGSVLACLAPLPEEAKASKRSIRKYYHSTAYPTSDIDLFLWGLNPQQAEAKIIQIYEAVRDSVPWDVTCVRTKHTVSIHSQYPYRSVQIVLRLYSSPAEILAGFDIDAPCCAYDGTRVYANPRAIVAMMRQCNTVDMTRRSPSYEVRFAKYAARGFEVYVPNISRADIDPTIYERSIVRITGLARLLVLEKLTNTDTRFKFLESRRALRGRPNPLNRYNKRSRKFKGDLKGGDSTLPGIEMNDYDVGSLHIPYGPGWDARRIDKLIYQTDLGMNSTFNPKNKGRRLHRHPAFFGTIQECMEDCCENCPAAIDEDEHKLQAEEDESYIRGRISFLQENPGRQTLSGSFNPIDVGEWSAQVYIGPTERFFAAIAAYDRVGVAHMLSEGQDVHRRDHVGRTPLHVAIMCRAAEIACDLVDAGARITARLVDGRSSLHLAAQHDLLSVVRKLLERSAVNAEKLANGFEEDDDEDNGKDAVETERERLSSEDDWSSEEDDMDEAGDAKPKKSDAKRADSSETPTNVGDLPEDEADQPDVFDINLADWDMTYTPLAFGIVFGSPLIVEELLNAGADAKFVMQAKGSYTAALPLMLTALGEDDERTCKIAECLILAGASCTATDQERDGRTIFYRAVEANKPNLVATFLRCDPNANVALNHPTIGWAGAITPLVAAVAKGHYSVIATMVAHGAKFALSQEELERAFAASKFNFAHDKSDFQPLESALLRHDDVVRLLTDLGAEINVGVKRALKSNSRPEDRRTILDWVQYALSTAGANIAELDKKINPPEISTAEALPGWEGYLRKYLANMKIAKAKAAKESKVASGEEADRARWIDVKEYLLDTEEFLLEHGAKTWSAVYPDNVSTATDPKFSQFAKLASFPGGFSVFDSAVQGSKAVNYYYITTFYSQEPVPNYLDALYNELYEACYTGNNDRIQELCLPASTPSTGANLLQIGVSVSGENRHICTGFTPLFAAIAGRHWDTARLIVAITAAQYKPAAQTGRFRVSDITFDDDSDNESDDSDDTVEEHEINFVDIASRPSAIDCRVHPKDILQAGKADQEPFAKAIDDNDFEAFINIYNLYKHSPKHVELPSNILSNILTKDRAEMLDEYIRRTGSGINIETAVKAGDEPLPVVNDMNRIYLGLNICGKKRTDLAQRIDPNELQKEKFTVPIVWQAVCSGATSILEYLLGDRPLAAYQYYASNNSSDVARLLKRTTDLAKVLPEWLGWSMTPLGESPLTAAIVGKKLDTVKYLFTKSPRLMASFLHERLKYLGVNPLMIAVQLGCDSAFIDFLLFKSVSPAETDQVRGWNIFHHMCNKNHHELLEHLLSKLPRDVVEVLLAQQSKGRLNTPLHIAAKRGYKKAVQLIVEFSKSTTLVRNVEGFIPLHCAVRPGFPETIQILVGAAPAGLCMENGVGETPLDMAILQDLISRNRTLHYQNAMYGSYELQDPLVAPPRFNIIQLNTELPRLRATLAALLGSGILKEGTKAVADLFAFVEYMEQKLVEAKASTQDVKPAVVAGVETADGAKALASVKAAMGAHAGQHRQLVHLVDVQASVRDSLARTQPDTSDQLHSHTLLRHRSRPRDDEGGLEPEENAVERELRESFIYKHLETGPDNL
ncbi:ankyrin repeat protein [Mycena pura]|uniref:Ankyrin repeat protein n=1 Tax=Mycena pura TaxID=153505 RepID=A0AAD6V0W5_9AGAR|nr:ankyrin repeat protein [Mycena pura]